MLANPLRTRLIADAQIETDKVDAAAFVVVARQSGGSGAYPRSADAAAQAGVASAALVGAAAHACPQPHPCLLARQHDLELPQCADLLPSAVWAFCDASN